MSAIAELDVGLRGAAVLMLLATGALFLLRGGMTRRSLSISALCFSIMAYILVSSPHLSTSEGNIAVALGIIAGLSPILVYWAGIELFLDTVSLDWRHGFAAAGVAFGAWFHELIPGMVVVREIVVLGLYLHLIYIAARTAAGDLVETRRQFRRWFLIIMAFFGVVIGTVELFDLDRNLPHYLYPLHALGFVVLSTVFALWAFQLRGDLWTQPAPPKSEEDPGPSPAVRALLGRLQIAMDEEIWRQEGLTVGQLAAHLQTPEHRLRQAINRELGHRNFAAFVNQHRIAAAKAILTDPERAEMSILTIAHEVGFASLGPFNRAFRELTGQNPSDFRRHNHRASPQN